MLIHDIGVFSIITRRRAQQGATLWLMYGHILCVVKRKLFHRPLSHNAAIIKRHLCGKTTWNRVTVGGDDQLADMHLQPSHLP